MFPSFYEGWGLPVTESLAFGKPLHHIHGTSLPEAGGKLARSFDPDNLHDAYHVIRQVIDDRPGLARWEAEVRREFKPVPWSATVEAILVRLGMRPDHLRCPCLQPDPSARANVSSRSAYIYIEFYCMTFVSYSQNFEDVMLWRATQARRKRLLH